MKITIGGLPGSGTTTSARLIERNLGFKHIYAGLIFRELAEERGMSLEEFSKHAEGNRDIDNLIDRKYGLQLLSTQGLKELRIEKGRVLKKAKKK